MAKKSWEELVVNCLEQQNQSIGNEGELLQLIYRLLQNHDKQLKLFRLRLEQLQKKGFV